MYLESDITIWRSKPIPLSTYIKTSFYLDKKEEINFYANIHTDQRKVYIRMYVLCSGKYDTYYTVIDFFRIYHIVHRNFRYDISNSSLVIFFKFNIRFSYLMLKLLSSNYLLYNIDAGILPFASDCRMNH